MDNWSVVGHLDGMMTFECRGRPWVVVIAAYNGRALSLSAHARRCHGLGWNDDSRLTFEIRSSVGMSIICVGCYARQCRSRKHAIYIYSATRVGILYQGEHELGVLTAWDTGIRLLVDGHLWSSACCEFLDDLIWLMTAHSGCMDIMCVKASHSNIGLYIVMPRIPTVLNCGLLNNVCICLNANWSTNLTKLCFWVV